MGITLVQADKSTVSATDDARLFQLLASGAEGIAQGCQITHKGGKILHITSGWGLVQGRCFVVTDQDITINGSNSAPLGRLAVRVQPSQTSPVLLWQSSAAGALRPLQKDPINYGGSIYEMELCRYRISSAVLSDLQVTVPRISSPGGAVYTATFRLNGWASGSGKWTQTVACQGMQAAFDTFPPFIVKTGNKDTDKELQGALNQLTAGLLETLDGQVKATVYSAPPTTDIKIYMQRAELPK